ncbi:MAG: dynamin family protein [Cyanobacteria bacterium P01_H01_bin.26]
MAESASMVAITRLTTSLRQAVGLLDPSQAELKAQVLAQCDRIGQPTLRITVFGPFNHGKSTLLNALLGEKALPIDLVPTTGAAITVTHGAELASRITLTDGRILDEPGTDLLQRYAVLDDWRRLRPEVAAVTVRCPHPLLQPGVELVDLPGTADQEMQNELVYTRLLETDVVIQLLDGRKLMTLTERDQLQGWLLERGITTVLFVVNFLNLMEPADRQQVMSRLRFVAQEFRVSLPDGIGNLYAVDALPALRARLKGDRAAATQAGLLALESALHRLVQVQLPEVATHRLPRLLPLTARVQHALQQRLQALDTAPDSRRTAIQQRAQRLIQTGFEQSAADLQDWLQLPNLLACYQSGFTAALQQGTALHWLGETLQPVWQQKKGALVEWVYKGCDFFDQPRPADLWISWSLPDENLPPDPPEETQATTQDMTPVAIATGLGWVLGGPMGAAVLGGATHWINRSEQPQAPSSNPSAPSSAQGCDAARSYLANFSKTALAALELYKTKARPVLHLVIVPPPSQHQRAGQRVLIQNILGELSEAVETAITLPAP